MHTEPKMYLNYKIAEDYSNLDGSTDVYLMREGHSSFVLAGFPIPHDAPYTQQLDKALFDIFSVCYLSPLYEKCRIIKFHVLLSLFVS